MTEHILRYRRRHDVRRDRPDPSDEARETRASERRGKTSRTLGLLVGLLVLTPPLLGAGASLAVQAPTVMLAPGHLVVQTVVEPDSANRAIQVVAESPDSYRSSEVQLEGDAAPRKNTFEFKDLPSGIYQIHATLLGAGGQQRALVVRRLEVIAHAH
jgi:hypothetical protein